MKLKPNWTVVSIMSRFMAQGIGLLQSLFMISLLSVDDFGKYGLVKAIVAYVGVYQNLGISSGSTREIAAAHDKRSAFKVFTASLTVRYIIALPLAIGLFVLAPQIGAEHYGKPEIVWAIRLNAIVLLLQAFQSVLNSAVQGLKRFAFLFSFQVISALMSLVIMISLISRFRFIGIYYGLIVYVVVYILVVGVYVGRMFWGNIQLPTKQEFVKILKAVFSIGIFMYVVKILSTSWENLGNLYLGNVITGVELGALTFAIFIGGKIMMISDAITDVTLPSFTHIYERTREDFQKTFLRGTSKAFKLILFSAVFLVVTKVEIFQCIDFVLGLIHMPLIAYRYTTSFRIVDPIIFAFVSYSMINLLTAGLAVPTKKMIHPIISYAVLLVSTFVIYHQLHLPPLLAFSIATFISTTLAYLVFMVLAKISNGFFPICWHDLLFVLISGVFLILHYAGLRSYAVMFPYILVTGLLYYRIYVHKKNVQTNIS